MLRPPAPRVMLCEATPLRPDPSGAVLSADLPHYWTAVPYGPLTVEVNQAVDPALPAAVEQVVLMIDGEPISNNRYMTGPIDPPELLPDGQLLQTYIYNLPCPELGKHLIQAHYKIGGIWSELSEPLRYEVRLPQPPRIIAMADSISPPAPLADIGLVSVRSSSVTLKLANVVAGDKILVEINGRVIAPLNHLNADCCVTVPVQGHVASGVHRIAVRSIHGADSCSITTELSNEVAFHYHDENVYLLRPGRGCETGAYCPTASDAQSVPAQGTPTTPTQPTTPQPGQRWRPPVDPSRVGSLPQYSKTKFLNAEPAPLPHAISNELVSTRSEHAPSDYSVRLIAQQASDKIVPVAMDSLNRIRIIHHSTLKAVAETRGTADDAVAKANAAAATVVAAAAEHEQALEARTNAERVWRETKAWVEGTKPISSSAVILANSANDAAWRVYNCGKYR